MDANAMMPMAQAAAAQPAALQPGGQQPGLPAGGGHTQGSNATPAEAGDAAAQLAKSAFNDTLARPERVGLPQEPGSLLQRLDQLDRQFLDSINRVPNLEHGDLTSAEGMLKVSQQLLEHQASLTRASIGVSMVSSGTMSFRDGLKQVLSNN